MTNNDDEIEGNATSGGGIRVDEEEGNEANSGDSDTRKDETDQVDDGTESDRGNCRRHSNLIILGVMLVLLGVTIAVSVYLADPGYPEIVEVRAYSGARLLNGYTDQVIPVRNVTTNLPAAFSSRQLDPMTQTDTLYFASVSNEGISILDFT